MMNYIAHKSTEQQVVGGAAGDDFLEGQDWLLDRELAFRNL